jgi:hypothetical protein
LGYFMSSSSFTIAVFSAIGMSTSMKYVNNRSEKLVYVCIGCRMIGMILFVLSFRALLVVCCQARRQHRHRHQQ